MKIPPSMTPHPTWNPRWPIFPVSFHCNMKNYRRVKYPHTSWFLGSLTWRSDCDVYHVCKSRLVLEWYLFGGGGGTCVFLPLEAEFKWNLKNTWFDAMQMYPVSWDQMPIIQLFSVRIFTSVFRSGSQFEWRTFFSSFTDSIGTKCLLSLATCATTRPNASEHWTQDLKLPHFSCMPHAICDGTTVHFWTTAPRLWKV